MAALNTLLRLASAIDPQEVRELVAQLEQQAAEYLVAVQARINNPPAEIIAGLVKNYPLLSTLQHHPQAEGVICKIVEVLRERAGNDHPSKQ